MLEKAIFYDLCVLLTTLLAFALLHFVLQGQTFPLLQIYLDFYFCIPVHYDEKNIFFFLIFGVNSRRSYGSSLELFNFSFFSISGWGIDLDYYDVEWFALEMNQDHSVIFEIAPKYCISDFLLAMQCRRCKRPGFNPWVRKIPWKGGGNLLQYPCLENPMDRGQQSMESQESDMTKRLNYHHCEGCCIPSKGFLPTVVDTMVI